jgi:hypothetical protein
MRYSSYSFLTSALDGDEWSASRPGRALPPGKGPSVPIGQEAGWAPEPVWTQRLEEKLFAPAGDRTPIARSLMYLLQMAIRQYQRRTVLEDLGSVSLEVQGHCLLGLGDSILGV